MVRLVQETLTGKLGKLKQSRFCTFVFVKSLQKEKLQKLVRLDYVNFS